MSGICPRRMRCALVMIWLFAACRNTSVRRTTGTTPLSIKSRKHRARPNGRKLVHVADQNQSGVVGKSPQQRVHQQHIHHRGLIHDQQVAGQRVGLVPA